MAARQAKYFVIAFLRRFRCLRSPGALAVASHHHSSVAENRRKKSGFSFANGDCVTHMRQGFPLQRFFAAPSRSICSSRAYRPVAGSCEVREFHSYVVDVGSIIINMEIVSRHDRRSRCWREHSSLSATDARDRPPAIHDNPAQAESFLSSAL